MVNGRKITLHVGFPKCGSTTIQRFLYRNIDVLRGKYSTEYSLDLGYQIVDFVDNKITSLDIDSLFQTGITHLIVSYEKMSSRLNYFPDIIRLRDELSRYVHSVDIVCYIRRQDDFVKSSYTTSLLGGNTIKMTDYIKSPPKYNQRLQQWSQIFGSDHVHVRLFERSRFFEGDFLHDVCHYFGFNITHFERVAPANITPCLEILELQRLLNILLADNPNRRAVIKALMYSEISGTPFVMPHDKRCQIIEDAERDNLSISRRYFNGSALFEDIVETKSNMEADLTADQIESMSQKILKACGILYEKVGFDDPVLALNYVAKYLVHIPNDMNKYISLTSREELSLFPKISYDNT